MLPEFAPVPRSSGLSLYIHFPFCRFKCLYCDFFSVAGPLAPGYRAVLSETIAQTKYFLDAAGHPPVRTVYFGGGTPNVLPEEDLAMFFEEFSGLLDGPPDEWTIEVNPEVLTAEQLELFQAYGIGRISMGVQTFREELLDLLGRHAKPVDVSDALALLSGSWKGSVNLDLITGIPGMTAGVAEADLERIIAAHPDHISLYTLTVEEGTPLASMVKSGTVRELPEDLRERLWLDGVKELERAGYAQYEISNFALPGRESLHNLRYWRMLPYAGTGPSAVSTLPGPHGAVRVENPKNLSAFRKGGDAFWGAEVTELTDSELYFEHLMMGLRLSEGVDLGRLLAVFGVSPVELLPDTIDSWSREGLLREDGGYLRLSGDGRYLQNRFLVEALDELETREHLIQELSWP